MLRVCEDLCQIISLARELIDPTPILIKEGLFKKPRVIKIDPFCKNIVSYTGKKHPINKKPVKIYKMH